jgi:pyrimidine deaminase RibD-like protein
MRAARIALVVGFTLIVAAVAVVLLGHPAALARANGARPERVLTIAESSSRVCQAGELVPSRTTAIVAWLGAFTGPRVSAVVTERGRVIARGTHGSAWTGRSVTISLDRALRDSATATVCFSFAPRYEGVVVRGSPVAGTSASSDDGRSLAGTLAIEYVRPGRGGATWLARASTIADHLGLGRVPSGNWAVVVALLLAIGLTVAVAALLARELR